MGKESITIGSVFMKDAVIYEPNKKINKKDLNDILKNIEKENVKDPFENFWNGLSYKGQIILNDVMKRYAESQGGMVVYGKRRNPIDLKTSDNMLKVIEIQEPYKKHIYVDFSPIIQPDFRKQNIIPIHKNK